MLKEMMSSKENRKKNGLPTKTKSLDINLKAFGTKAGASISL